MCRDEVSIVVLLEVVFGVERVQLNWRLSVPVESGMGVYLDDRHGPPPYSNEIWGRRVDS
jgi:hypothetical protein